MAWIKRKVQGHIESFRGDRKSSSSDKVNIDVKVAGPDEGLHLSDLESSLSSSQGDFRTLIQQQKQQEEAEEATKKSKTSKLKVKGHRRGRSDGTIFIKDRRHQRDQDTTAIFNVSNNLLRQMSTSSGSLDYKGSYGQIQSGISGGPIQKEFTNMSFLTEPDDDESEKSREITLTKWQSHKHSLENNYCELKKAIGERQNLLVSVVSQCANEMFEKLQKKYEEQKAQADKCITTLELSNKGSQFGLGDSSTMLASLPTIPQNTLNQLTYQTEDTLKEAMSQLFGNFQTIQARGSIAPTSSPEKEKNKSTSLADESSSSGSQFMSRPQYLGTISAKTSKDVRECGVTDMAFTKDKQVIVVDKHNKLVKVFDTDGKLVRYIGKNILKDPSRVSVLPWNDQIVITDSGGQEVKLFTLDGALVTNIASDLSSPSGQCVIPDSHQIAVINFDTKLVSIYEEDMEGTFKKLRSFPTGLDCPAYITCTASNNIVISDWSANKFRIYNNQGKFIKQMSKPGSGQGQISKPQGVHGDCHGNLFLGEKGNRRIQIFNEEGDSTFLMDKNTYDLHLPMAVDTTEDGYMLVAEYQGNIKFFKYLDLPETEEMEIGQRPKGRAISVVSPEVLVPKNESAL